MHEIFYPFFVFLAGAIISLLVGKFKYGDVARLVSIISVIATAVTLFFLNPFNGDKLFNDLIKLDSYGAFFTYLFLFLAIATIIGSMKLLDNKPEMPSLVLIATFGIIIVACANDLFMLFIGWEIMSIATYILTGLGRTEQSTEGAMKYFIYGAVSSALIIYAISFVYGLTGTTRLENLANIISTLDASSISVIGLIFALFIFGFGYKAGIVPFHLWLPDAYEGAPRPVTAFIAGVAKKVALVASARILFELLINADFDWSLIIGLIAVVTMSVGNVVALAQKRVARMFAYSSISQVGYILIGFAALSQKSFAGAIFQITTHAITTIGTFIAIGIVSYKLNLETTDDYKGLGRRNPLLGITLTVMMLSLAGIPPFIGFFSKLYLFSAAVEANLLWLAIIGILNSVLSLGYYLPLVRNMFLLQSEDEMPLKVEKRLFGPMLIVVLTAIALLVLSFAVESLRQVLEIAAEALVR